MRRPAIWCGCAIAIAIAIWRLLPTTADAGAPARVPASLHGTLRGSDGGAVLGRVEVLAFDDSSPAPVSVAEALAFDGRYQLEVAPSELRPGRYFAVRAHAAGYASTGRQLELVEGRSQVVDLRLVAGPGRLELTARTTAGEPLEDAEVVISFVPRSGDRGALTLHAGATDARGRFAIPDLAPIAGTVHWSVRTTGRGRAFGEHAKPRGNATVAIEAALVRGLALEVTTRDPAGVAVPGVELELTESDGSWSARGVSDERGRIALDDVPRDTAVAYRPRSNHVLAGGYDETAFQTGGGDTQQLVVVVGEARRITGVVRDAAGDPIGGAAINAQAVDRDMGSPRRAVSDALGRFELAGLRDGLAWDLDARHPGYAPAFVEHVGGDAEVALVLSRGGGLRGRVVDLAGRAASGIEIYVHRVERTAAGVLGLAELATTTTEADGRWELARLNPGSYRVEYRSGARMQWQPVAAKVDHADVVPDELRDLGSVAVARGAALEGLVDPRATSLEVAILPHGRGGAPHAMIASAHAGRFVLGELAPGDYDITLRDPALGYSEQRHVALVDGARTRATFAFAGTATLTGRVVDARGAAIARAEVDVFAPAGGTQATHPLPTRAPDNLTGNRAFGDEQGAYVIRGLAPGHYRVRITTPASGVLAGELELPAAGATRDWALPRPARLEIELPVAASIVLVDSVAGAAIPIATSGTRGDDGVARVDNLPPGTYRVRAVAPGLPELPVSLVEGEARHVTIPGGTP